MPSPFPGMDPYVEGDLWTSFHAQMAAEIARQLAPKLAPRYVALTEKRYLLDMPEESAIALEARYPDVGIVKSPKRGAALRPSNAPTAPLEMATVMTEEVPHFFVEIRDIRRRRLVTLIEFLSPTNKRGQGRHDYLSKREKLLRSTAHLLEIDLLRRGRRLPMRQALPSVPYFVFLSRASRRPITEIWPIALSDPLPPVPVPLLGDDPDVTLDIQEAFRHVYDVCRFDLLIDYRQPPDIPLSPELAKLAKRILRSASKSK